MRKEDFNTLEWLQGLDNPDPVDLPELAAELDAGREAAVVMAAELEQPAEAA